MGDWKLQLTHAVENSMDLKNHQDLTAIEEITKRYRMRITPHLLSLMDFDDPTCPIRMQFIPSPLELSEIRGRPDPKKEEGSVPVPCLFQLYKDRVALYLTNSCAAFCRHCLRKRRFSHDDTFATHDDLRTVFSYLRSNPEIRDVLITGGDPFLADDGLIEFCLQGLRSIPSIEIIRIGTRTLLTLPERITPELAAMIAKYHPVFVNTQFNHPKEITATAANAADILLKEGIPLGNQSVLLAGINDDIETMKELVQSLLRIRIKPYYLYHCHFVQGGTHFQTEISKGIDIIKGLQGYTTGFAVPRYIISTPKGKIPLNDSYIASEDGQTIVLKNYEGSLVVIDKKEGPR